MVEAVEAADAVADIVVVTIHWGSELDTEPRPDDIARAEAMIEAGADIIFGHHQHRLNPLEMVKESGSLLGNGKLCLATQLDSQCHYRCCPGRGQSRWDNRRLPHPGFHRDSWPSGAHR